MPAEARMCSLVALEVADDESYARYRAGMMPILERFGGRFEHDFVVSKVLKTSVDAAPNRVFVISFPSRDRADAFFADPDYLAVRKQHFEPAVRSTHILAWFESN